MPAYPKKYEREYAEMTTYMIEQMEKRFINQVFKEMHQSTLKKFEDDDSGTVEYPVPRMSTRTVIDKFTSWTGTDGSVYDDYDQCIPWDAVPHTKETERRESFQDGWDLKEESIAQFLKGFKDAQVGNYAVVFTKLAKRAKRKIIKQFSDDRIEAFTKKTLGNVDKYNKDIFYGRLEDVIGIDRKQLIAQEAMKSTTNALMLETAQWSKKLRDDTLEFFTANSLRMMTLGTDYETILSEFKKTGKEKKNHAKFIARNQVASFNAISSKVRAQNLGITRAIWVTSKDERVRRCHDVRNGKEFDLDKGLYSSCDSKTLLPGVDYNCRCISQFIVGEEDAN